MDRRTFLATLGGLAAVDPVEVPAANNKERVRTTSNAPPRKVIIGTAMQSFWGQYPGLRNRLDQLERILATTPEEVRQELGKLTAETNVFVTATHTDGFSGLPLGWNPASKYLHEDVLCLFGTYPKPLGDLRGFDVVNTSGKDVGLGVGSTQIAYGDSPRHVMIPTNFGAANFIQTNLHGVFWLRFHGDTNAVAEIQIR